MKKVLWILCLILSAASVALAQPGGGMAAMRIGRFYGKVVDEQGKGVGYATVKLFGKKFDPATRSLKDTLWAGQLTADNGDFNLEKLPIAGDFDLVISFIGYPEMKQKVTFGVPMPPMGKGGPGRDSLQRNNAPGTGKAPGAGGFPPAGGGPMAMSPGTYDKDLGNIRLIMAGEMLNEVTVTAKASGTTLSLDRKSYRVDKDLTAAGGNAQDALKNVPSLSVDLDGNVTLRNGAPQIFVDGRPTTLSLDQIPADAIETVEVITNPSAKYDAGGGTAGIVNIVLKKERKLGYNGNVRAGADTRGGFNLGGDINARGEKINLFAALNVNQHKGKSEGQTLRENLYGTPFTNVTQENTGRMNGLFANGRAGVDFFLDNRNTLTLSGNYTRGKFRPGDDITTTTDYLYPTGITTESYTRQSQQDRGFRNLGASLQFKHLFPKKGAEWTADANFNAVKFEGESDYNTVYSSGLNRQEQQNGSGSGRFVTIQTDAVYPLNDRTKIETGARGYVRWNNNDNANSYLDNTTQEWIPVVNISDHYKYTDQVYAAYGQMSHQRGKWGFQAGLRAESSLYSGALTDRDSSFQIAYPFSLFPSAFVTYKINERDQLQLAYTRRVNRPGFFQTMPFTDFSDSLNLRRGNPTLLPEFTNSIELSWQKIFSKGHNLLISTYYKRATNLIAGYQFTEFNPDLEKQVVITSYANSEYADALGGEFTLKNSLLKWLDLTTNVNVFRASVDAGNVEEGLTVNRWSAFVKENVQVKLPKGWALQINGEYRTRASFTPSNNNDPFRGGPHGGATNTAQGYTISNWFTDVSLRKEFMQRKASVSVSMQDVFATRKMGSVTESAFFTQDTWRIMNPRMVRVNFMYRFGKMDTSLFQRKNMKTSTQGNDMM